jgi:hypothetical protein
MLVGILREHLKVWLGSFGGDAFIVITGIMVVIVEEYFRWTGSILEIQRPEDKNTLRIEATHLQDSLSDALDVEEFENVSDGVLTSRGSQPVPYREKLSIPSTSIESPDKYTFFDPAYKYIKKGVILSAFGLLFLLPGIYLLIYPEANIRKVPKEELFIGVFIGFVLLAVGLVLIIFRDALIRKSKAERARKQELWKKKLSVCGEEYVISEFQRRRKRLIPFALLPILTALLIPTLFSRHLSRDNQLWVFLLGFVIFATGMGFMAFIYRCPICGLPPMTHPGGMISKGGGVDLNPDCCPTCGVRLK